MSTESYPPPNKLVVIRPKKEYKPWMELSDKIDELLKQKTFFLQSSGLESDVDGLRETLSGVQDVLMAVPKMGHRPIYGTMIGFWIKQIRQVLYDVEDVAAEFTFNPFRETGFGLINRKKDLLLFFEPDSITIRDRMHRKIKNLNLRLEQLAAQKAKLAQEAEWKLLTLERRQLSLVARKTQLNLAKGDVNSRLLQEVGTNHSHVVNVLDLLNHRIKYSYYKGSRLEWTFLLFLLSNLSLEVLSAYLDQNSSPTRPRCAFIAMIVSFVTLLICLVELRLKATRNRLRQSNGLFYQSLTDKPLESFLDNFGLLCTMVQCVTSAIQYAYFKRHQDNPLKLSFFPLFLAIYVIISNLRIGN